MRMFFRTRLQLVILLAASGLTVYAQDQGVNTHLMEVGVASIDITPEAPIRLAGYGARKKVPSEGIMHWLRAKALAFGTDAQGPSVLITVDLLGIPGHITKKIAQRLAEKTGIDQASFAISASRTHGGPELGNTLNILQYRGDSFSDSLLALDHLVEIAQYTHELYGKLEEVALAALKNRTPAQVAWDQGEADFARNRRSQGGPVDRSLPVLRITDPSGNLRAVLVNYACHGTTLSGDVNSIHGDWMSEAQQLIEANHPGSVALMAIGCGADANPHPRGEIEHVRMHAEEIAANVGKLLKSPMQPLTTPPSCRMKWVRLPFAHVPSVPELIAQSTDKSVKGYYARLALERIARGGSISPDLDYPVQVWTFGNDLAMINLAGEVVVDYALRLKNELGAEKLWVNAYTNDAPCYIASRRVIGEGGYEAETSMYWYDKPSPFSEEVEDIIVSAVRDLLPEKFKERRPSANRPAVVQGNGDTTRLRADIARSVGPEIKYMPEWRAFGWFTESDRVEWDLTTDRKATYDVFLEWSVSDEEAGKPFLLEVSGNRIKGEAGKTGSWITFRKERIGRLRLPAGSHKVIFRPDPKSPKGALMDLRELTLVRIR